MNGLSEDLEVIANQFAVFSVVSVTAILMETWSLQSVKKILGDPFCFLLVVVTWRLLVKKSLFEAFCFGLGETWRLPPAPVKKTPLGDPVCCFGPGVVTWSPLPVKKTPLADPVCCFGLGVVTWSPLPVKKSLVDLVFYYVCFLLVET